MKKILIAIVLAAAVLAAPVSITGCRSPSAQSTTYKTLAGIGAATDSAVKAYFDLVVRGQVKTNGVPSVAKAYSDFQLAYGAAVQLAQFNPTNQVVSANLAAAAASVTVAIAAAK